MEISAAEYATEARKLGERELGIAPPPAFEEAWWS
jgi:hypothetical protein